MWQGSDSDTPVTKKSWQTSDSDRTPEMDLKKFFVNLSDIRMILRIILEYWIKYCMSYVHDISIIGHFWPARNAGGRVVSYRETKFCLLAVCFMDSLWTLWTQPYELYDECLIWSADNPMGLFSWRLVPEPDS